MNENECAHRIIGAAIEVHRHLGPGLLESAYPSGAVQGAGLARSAQRVPGQSAGELQRFRVGGCVPIDLVVEDLVVVEIKAVQALLPLHKVQLLTYLRFTGARLGLLLNFHTVLMRDGIRRVVNGLKSS